MMILPGTKRLLLVVAILFTTWSSNVVVAEDQDEDEEQLMRWVITFNNVLPDNINTLLGIAGIELPEFTLTVPELFMGVLMLTPSVAKRVAKLPIVKYVEHDVEVKLVEPIVLDTDITTLQRQRLEITPYGIEMVQALEVDDSNVGNRMVCIIDSGYDLGHFDLPGSDVVSGSSTVGIQPWFRDDNSHGTHVSGIVAALGGNGRGVMGVNRNGQLRLHIVRIFDESGQTFSSNVVADVQECINAGANVVSMSFGRDDGEAPIFGGGPLEFEREAFDKFYEEGTLLIAAAGNSGTADYNWPASYDSVMSVAAVDENRQVADFSQRNDAVDICAPGVGVASTIVGDDFALFSGTSMSTPHVSGVAALVWSHFPEKSAQEIWTAIISTAEDLGTAGKDPLFGYGLVQAAAAMDFLANDDANAVPTPSPPGPSSPPSGECVDDLSWEDRFGDGCEWYDVPFLCRAFGPLSSNNGKTAFEACCACGGGLSAEGGTTDGATSTSAAMQLPSAFPLFALFCSVAIVFHAS